VAPGDDRLEMTILELIVAAGMVDQVVISSWDQVALARIRARRSGVQLAVDLCPRVPDPVAQMAWATARLRAQQGHHLFVVSVARLALWLGHPTVQDISREIERRRETPTR